MSDILRAAIRHKMIEFPLTWRKDALGHWTARAGGTVLCVTARPGSGGTWVWGFMRGASVVEHGPATDRRGAMNKAEAAIRKYMPIPTDVQIVTGWIALRSGVPDTVLAAASRLAERDKAERAGR